MTIDKILSNNYQLYTDIETLKHDFQTIYATDLLSSAIKSAKNHEILITLIAHETTLGVAIMMDLPCIIFTENKIPSISMITKANEENICLISTTLKTHEVIIDFYVRGLL